MKTTSQLFFGRILPLHRGHGTVAESQQVQPANDHALQRIFTNITSQYSQCWSCIVLVIVCLCLDQFLELVVFAAGFFSHKRQKRGWFFSSRSKPFSFHPSVAPHPLGPVSWRPCAFPRRRALETSLVGAGPETRRSDVSPGGKFVGKRREICRKHSDVLQFLAGEENEGTKTD